MTGLAGRLVSGGVGHSVSVVLCGVVWRRPDLAGTFTGSRTLEGKSTLILR